MKAFGQRNLRGRLRFTETRRDRTYLAYDLEEPGRQPIPVTETHYVPQARGATGITRRIEIGPVRSRVRLRFRLLTVPVGAVPVSGHPKSFTRQGSLRLAVPEEYPLWMVFRGADGTHLILVLDAHESTALVDTAGEINLLITLSPGSKRVLHTSLLKCDKWTAEVQDNLESDLEEGR
jgi:hypothetical protein